MFFLILLWQFAACIGFGLLGLKTMGLLDTVRDMERLPFAFALGFGLLGWIVFPVALAGGAVPLPMATTLAAGLGGLFLLPRCRIGLIKPPASLAHTALLLLLGIILLSYLMQGLAPPADGDSMAYHFARIKLTAHDGRLTYLPQAIEGAGPMLAQMTYLPAFILGGETAMTLWTTLSGLMASLFLYALARRWLASIPALVLALLLLTTPVAIYSTSSGQVEIRNALFVMAGAFAAIEARRTALWRWAVLAGLCAGFFAAAKPFGLLWIASSGFIVLLQRDGLRQGACFGAAALLAACQWYGWNYVMTGDPLFPMLFTLLGLQDGPWWTAGHFDSLMAQLRNAEQPAPPTIGWYLAYPFRATLDGLPMWESGRTGLGLFGLLSLPFAVAGLWRRAAQPGRSPLWDVVLMIFLFYTLWFFFGTAQRVRHLLPIYPLLLLILGIAALRAAELPALRRPLFGGIFIVLTLQLGGLILFTTSPAKALLTGETRESYLARSIPFFDVVPWINTNLKSDDKILLTERQLLYPLNVPYFFADFLHQALIDLRFDSADDHPARWQTMQKLGVTHVLLVPELEGNAGITALHRTLAAFLADNCARRLHRQNGRLFASRTLSGNGDSTQVLEIYTLTPESCRMAHALPKSADLATTSLIPNDEMSQ